MGFLNLAIAFILDILFPLRRFYEAVSTEEGNHAGTVMGPDRTPPMGSPEYPYPRSARLETTARRERRSIVDETARYGGRLPRFAEFDDLFEAPGVKARGHRRNSPTPPKVLESLEEETHTPAQVHHVDHADRSKRLFQDRLDECSESDVIRQCESLNEKINSTALSLVDEWMESPSISRNRLRGLSVLSDSKHSKSLRYAIGIPLCSLIKRGLSSPPSEELQNSVVDALQTLAIQFISQLVMDSFSQGVSASTNKEMHRMFHSMLSQEPLAAALRWRALAYKHSFVELKTATLEYQESLSLDFAYIFRLAGESSSSKILPGIPEAIRDSEIIESALELSELLKTKLFSVYLDIYTIQPGEMFHEDLMEFDSSNKVAIGHRRVLCTLEIGLREISPQTGPGRILLKPKVALEK